MPGIPEAQASRSWEQLPPPTPAGTLLSLCRPWGGGGWWQGQHRRLSLADLLQKRSIGAKEETGFTEESSKNPNVFQPPSQALPGNPVSQAEPHENLRVNPRVSGLGQHSEGRR